MDQDLLDDEYHINFCAEFLREAECRAGESEFLVLSVLATSECESVMVWVWDYSLLASLGMLSQLF